MNFVKQIEEVIHIFYIFKHTLMRYNLRVYTLNINNKGRYY